MKISATLSPDYKQDADFEHLFRTHYKALHAYASMLLKEEDDAEEIVQQLFLKCWERRELLNESVSVKAYLYKCVYHDCLNWLKHQKVKNKYQDHASYHNDGFAPTHSRLELNELQQQLNLALDDLPEQCRLIFQLSRFEELKYREIADELGISIKTVENQMSKALRILRVKLVDFLIIVLSILSHFKTFIK